MRRGFTLIEILVSVAVLVAIVLVCGRIFQAASSVTTAGAASGDALAEVAAIKKQIRDDLSRLSRDGVLSIHSLMVPNDYNRSRWNGSGARPGLINPSLPPDAPVRCDQLLFFAEGTEHSQSYGSNVNYGDLPGFAPKSLGGASMVRYGHALQFPELQAYDPVETTGHDVDYASLRDGDGYYAQSPLVPFHQYNVNSVFGGVLPTLKTTYYLGAGGGSVGLYDQESADDIRGSQPEARKWLLARTAVALGDDDSQWPGANSKRVYQNESLAQESIFPVDPRRTATNSAGFSPKAPVVDYGRVDIAASLLGDVREALMLSRLPAGPSNNVARRPWRLGRDNDAQGTHAVLDGAMLPGDGDQVSLIKSLFAYPRAQRTPPGPARFDRMLTSTVLGSAVSDFIVEWTWDEGVGETRTVHEQPGGRRNDVRWTGFHADPWRGLDPGDSPSATVFDECIDGGLAPGERLWFGLPSWTDGDGETSTQLNGPSQFDRRVMTLGQLATAHAPADEPRSIHEDPPSVASPALVDWWSSDPGGDPNNVMAHRSAIDEVTEVAEFGDGQRVRQYWASFGPNHSAPLRLDDQNAVDDDGAGLLDPDWSYTPWPTALRFTMRVHDPSTNLENGKVVQFVVPLPKRVEDAL